MSPKHWHFEIGTCGGSTPNVLAQTSREDTHYTQPTLFAPKPAHTYVGRVKP